jgi:predicted Zn-dependent protease
VPAGFREAAALNQAIGASEDSEFGDSELAKRDAASALSLYPGQDVKMWAALTWARVGDATRADHMIAELEKSHPLNTLWNKYWLPTVKAAIKLNEGQAREAIRLLEPTSGYELAMVGPLYPAYVRGEAYLLARNGAAATIEFQKILDHPGVVFSDPIGALAHLQIGRAHAMTGDNTKAKAAIKTSSPSGKMLTPIFPS